MSNHKMSVQSVPVGNNSNVQTAIVVDESALDEAISWLLSQMQKESSSYDNRGLVGFGIEKSFRSSTYNAQFIIEKVAVVKFCTASHCLIVHLIHFATTPTSLAKFLNIPTLTFAGFGIKQDLADLHRDYGIPCRNAFELGPIVNPCRGSSGIVDVYNLRQLVLYLRSSTIKMIYRIPEQADFEDWDSLELSDEQIKLASADAYAAFTCGAHVIGLVNK